VAKAAEHPWVITAIAEALGYVTVGSVVECVQLLRMSSAFGGLPDIDLAWIADRAERLEIPENKAIIKKGEEGAALFMLAYGALRVHDGDHTLAILEPGAIVGELSALSSEHRSASVTTTAESVLFRLDRADLEGLLADRIEVARGVIGILVQRLRAMVLAGGRPGNEAGEQINLSAELGEVGEGTELSTLEKTIVLKTTPMFVQTPEAILAEVAQTSATRTLRGGEQLFAKGDEGRTMYIVIAGSLRVHDDHHTIAVLGPRTIVGELAVLASEPRTASVTAIGPTVLLELSRSALYELIWDRTEVVRGILTVLVQRLRSML
jgi:CRP-like cAMP-binding protein